MTDRQTDRQTDKGHPEMGMLHDHDLVRTYTTTTTTTTTTTITRTTNCSNTKM